MNKRMKRIAISLMAEQHGELRRVACERHTSMSKLLREAAVEIVEDAEDIREGLKALVDERGTITWDEYKKGGPIRCTRQRKP